MTKREEPDPTPRRTMSERDYIARREQRAAAGNETSALLLEADAFESDQRTQRASVLDAKLFEPSESDEDFAARELQLEARGERNAPKRARLAREQVRDTRQLAHARHLGDAVRTIAGLVKIGGESRKRSYSIAKIGEGSQTIAGSRTPCMSGHVWSALHGMTTADRSKLVAFLPPKQREALEAELAARTPAPTRTRSSGTPSTSGKSAKLGKPRRSGKALLRGDYGNWRALHRAGLLSPAERHAIGGELMKRPPRKRRSKTPRGVLGGDK